MVKNPPEKKVHEAAWPGSDRLNGGNVQEPNGNPKERPGKSYKLQADRKTTARFLKMRNFHRANPHRPTSDPVAYPESNRGIGLRKMNDEGAEEALDYRAAC